MGRHTKTEESRAIGTKILSLHNHGYLILCACTMAGSGTALGNPNAGAPGDTLKSEYAYDDRFDEGTLTVKFTTQNTGWDGLQLRCNDNDTAINFVGKCSCLVGVAPCDPPATGYCSEGLTNIGILCTNHADCDAVRTALWSFETFITKGDENKKYVKLKRSSPLASNETITIKHTGDKRGGKGQLDVLLSTNEQKPKYDLVTKEDDTMIAVGACTVQGSSTQCLCDISEEECNEKAGNVYLGDNTACPGECVPTVSQWGVAVMTLLVLTAATVVIMRRRAMVHGGS